MVLDTNVVISSLWSGRCWEIIKQWHEGRFRLAISNAILQEYLEVLGRFVDPGLLHEWVETLTDAKRVVLVEPTERIEAIPQDPSDNRFLECAIAAEADAIVSGDHDLLDLKTFRGIPILTPASFLKRPIT